MSHNEFLTLTHDTLVDYLGVRLPGTAFDVSSTVAPIATAALARASIYFTFLPVPNDRFEITVKNESRTRAHSIISETVHDRYPPERSTENTE